MEITKEQVIAAYEESGLKPGSSLTNCGVAAVYCQIHNMEPEQYLRKFHSGDNVEFGISVYNFIDALYGIGYSGDFGLGFDSGIRGKSLKEHHFLSKPRVRGHEIGQAVAEYFKQKTQTPDNKWNESVKQEVLSSL